VGNRTSAVAIHNLLLYGDLIRALRALSEAGIPAIVLKGAALADTIYPSIADRPMNDVDLLVRLADRDRARAALEGAGYHFLPEPRQRFGPFDTEFTGEMQFRRSEHNVIELHWELTASEWLRRLADLDMKVLWHDVRPFEIGGAQALQLSPCDTLLHLCLHLSAHSYAHENNFRDIRQLLDHERPFPWDTFVARARRFRLRSACYFVLDAVASELRASVPSDVLDVLRPPAWQRRLVPLIADPRRALAGQLAWSKPRGYLLHLALADRPMDVLRIMVWLFFPGPRWLGERYRLRGRLRAWLACLWHPLVVLSQGTLGLWELFKSR
jgi:hypothetical protein